MVREASEDERGSAERPLVAVARAQPEDAQRFEGLVLQVEVAVDYGTCGCVPNQSYGLSLDLLGATVLARGLLKGPYGIAAESGQYWSQSPPLRRALSEDAADGIWGVSLLVAGILVQFLAVAGVVIFPLRNCLV